MDEAHHVLPAGLGSAVARSLPSQLQGMGFVTVEPSAVAAEVLRLINVVIGVGAQGMDAVRAFATAAGQRAPTSRGAPPTAGTDGGVAVAWYPHAGGGRGAGVEVEVRADTSEPESVSALSPIVEHRRHIRNAPRDIGPGADFYFADLRRARRCGRRTSSYLWSSRSAWTMDMGLPPEAR